MLTTTELLAGIQQDYADTFSSEKLVRYLDRVQRTIFLDDTFELMYFNHDDPVFPLPILPTVDGQLTYVIDDGVLVDSDENPINLMWDSYAVEASKVLYVLTDQGYSSSSSYPGASNGWRGYQTDSNVDDNSVIIRGRKFRKEPVKLLERTPTNKPRITFSYNPGSTSKYYIGLAVVPPKISSARTPMSLNVDKWEKALIDGVVGECELAVNGRSERAERFLTYWLPKIRSSYNESMGEFMDTNVSHRRFG